MAHHPSVTIQSIPTRCYKCQRYGEPGKKCWAQEVCATCSATSKKYAACGDPQSSSDRECPKRSYKEALLVIKEHEKKKINEDTETRRKY
ncbi:hypothetical protein Hamer_G003168 [Homarus americanus]|uniref:Uncharacterized protein n=1 Tax=Homarus americanus TaxID=6706 RepID=A0A8J5TEX4_HOMAM|nr:hypothetical protein Hamer_G003168 [Homarus americanus]